MVSATRQRTVRYLLLGLGVLLVTLPLVSARTFRTGISPLNRVVEIISAMFNIPILTNPTVQIYFMRAMLFVLLLAVVYWVFAKKLKDKIGMDNKTAGIIATVFALISAFLMPEDWVMANGGVIVAVLSAIIPLGLVGGGIYLCTTSLDTNTWTRLVAIVILLMLLVILNVYEDALHLPVLLLFPGGVLAMGLSGKRMRVRDGGGRR